MKRLILLVVALAISAQPIPEDRTIQIVVGPDRDVTVIVPNMVKADVAGLIAGMFGRGDEAQEKKFKELMGTATRLTLTIRSYKEK